MTTFDTVGALCDKLVETARRLGEATAQRLTVEKSFLDLKGENAELKQRLDSRQPIPGDLRHLLSPKEGITPDELVAKIGEAMLAAKNGSTLNAISMLRSATGCGLMEAKNAVLSVFPISPEYILPERGDND